MSVVKNYNGVNENYNRLTDNVNTLHSICIEGKCIEVQNHPIYNGDCTKEEKCKTCNEDIATTLKYEDNETDGSVKEDCGDDEMKLTEISPNQRLVDGKNKNVILPTHFCDNADSQKHIEPTSDEINFDGEINNGGNILSNENNDKENIEEVSNVVSEHGSNTIQLDTEVNIGDKENLPYTLQLYLRKEDDSNKVGNTEGNDVQYEGYVIISSNDISITGTVNGNDNNEGFTEIELSDVIRGKSVINDGDKSVFVDGDKSVLVGDNKDVILSPQKEGSTETNSIALSQQAISENETSKDDSGNEASKDISENEISQSVSENGSINSLSTKEKIIRIFPKNADISITLKYMVSLKCIMGNIRSMNGLGYVENTTCPELIRFHVIILPEDRYRLRTKWVHASVKSLAWKFAIGPLPEDINTKGKNIRFRLYGRSKAKVPRCYGECFVPLEDVMESEKSVEFEETILPKGSLKNMNIKCREKSRGNNAPPKKPRSMLL